MVISEDHKSYQGTVFDNGKVYDLYLSHKGWLISDGEGITPISLEDLNARLKDCLVTQYNPLMICSVPNPGPFEVPVGTEPL